MDWFGWTGAVIIVALCAVWIWATWGFWESDD